MKIPFLQSKGFQPKNYATKDKEGDGWRVVPDVFYPTMIAHIRAVLGEEGLPEELVDRVLQEGVDPKMAARRYLSWARSISVQGWADAQCAPEEVAPERLAERASALECARLWFTRALKNAEQKPIHIRIERNSTFRLGR